MKLLKPLLIASAISAAPLALAGSPGGLELIALASSKAAPYTPAVAAYFKRIGHDGGASQCENAMVSVDNVQYQSARQAISSQMVLEAVFSKKKRQQLGTALSKVRDKDVRRGFDGALVYDVVGSDVVFYGVSADATEKVFTARVPVTAIDQPDKVNAALCHILVNLPVLVAP